MSASGAADLLVRPRSAHDGPLPAGNATAAEVFARLYFLTGEQSYAERAEATINAFAGEARQNIFPLAGLLSANDFLSNALQVVVMGERGDPATDRALSAVYSVSLPNRVVQVVADGKSFAENHPAYGKTGAPGVLFVCSGQQCSLPLEGATAIKSALLELRGAKS